MNIKSTLITTLLIGGLSSGAMAKGGDDDINYLKGFLERNKSEEVLMKMNIFYQLEREADIIWTLKSLKLDSIQSLQRDLDNLSSDDLKYVYTDYDRTIGLRRDIMVDLLNIHEQGGTISIKDDMCKNILVENYSSKYVVDNDDVVDIFRDIDAITNCFEVNMKK